MKGPALACLALLFLPAAAEAAPDVAEGRKLVEASKCEGCHSARFRGPVGTIYLRKDRRVTSWARLKSQVSACTTQLNLSLFPEDEESIAAFLNAAYYKFPEKPAGAS